MTFEEALSYLNSLDFRGIRLGLDNIGELLGRLDDPHKVFRSIHVTGTNGKGSTSAMIASILKESGVKTGLYTSPHLETVRERIVIDDAMIDEESFALYATTVKEAAEAKPALPITYFEFATALAFLAFVKNEVDMAVVEVGLGGRFDATNMVDPEISVITSIGLDHTKQLGDSLESVVMEKLGIVKEGVPLVTGVSDENLRSIILDETNKKRAPAHFIGHEFRVDSQGLKLEGESFTYADGNGEIENLYVPLAGHQQVENAALAIRTVRLLKDINIKVTDDSVKAGLANVNLMARFEFISKEPMVILDGAHNLEATLALASSLKHRFGLNSIEFIFGAMADKEYSKMMATLKPLARSMAFFSPPVIRAESIENMVAKLGAFDGEVNKFATVEDAVMSIKGASTDKIFCVTGSFYTVGTVRSSLVNSLPI